MNRLLAAAASALMLGFGAPAIAATQLTDGSGHLTGATGVTVGSATYDVTFAEGTCAGLFGGCAANSDFTFGGDALGAQAAAQALLAQVLTGGFDTDFALTFGCGAPNISDGCLALIPWDTGSGVVTAGAAYNTNNVSDPTGIGVGFQTSFDTTSAPQYVWALFAPSTAGAVPEPSTWAMMLLGFLGAGAALRRERRFPAAA